MSTVCIFFNIGWAEKTLIPLETTFGAHFKQAKVTEIKPAEKKVALSTGDELSYDILVIATGCVHKWPVKLVGVERDAACKQYDALVEKVYIYHFISSRGVQHFLY